MVSSGQATVGFRSLEIFLTRRTTTRCFVREYGGGIRPGKRNKSDSGPREHLVGRNPENNNANAAQQSRPWSTAAATATATATGANEGSTSTTTRGRLSQIITAGPLGKVGRWYSSNHNKRPYTTQVCFYIVLYLCGDVSAQWLFGPGDSQHNQKEEDKSVEGTAASHVGYDPWRTMRQMIVGVGSSVPTFKWYMPYVDRRFFFFFFFFFWIR